MQAWHSSSDGGRRAAGATLQPRRREACAYLAGSGLPVWPLCGWAGLRPLQRGRREFGELALGAARLGPQQRVGYLNDGVNQRVERCPDDPDHDHWATPYETLTRGAGDCEDSAIAKFFLLLASGAPDGGVRLLYAWQLVGEPPFRRRAHMVVVVRRISEDPWVLDSARLMAEPLSLRDDLVPVFSFDERRLWYRLDAEPLPPARSRLRPWQELLERWHAQCAH
ncbi:MAG: transglutaminase-like cysteine peptidase [Piscinibacter sp.]